jgi:4-hydroxy-2-oxoheptanedioate aldolase
VVATSAAAASLAERLKGGETVLSAWSNLPDPMTVEAVAATAFEAVTLDAQHGGHTEDVILRAIGPVTQQGKPVIVRIPVGRFDMASRMLDFGAQAVIAPMINSVADAEAFAKSMKYPPVGQRSWGAARAQAFFGISGRQDWLERANGLSLAIAMIETREAVAALDGILVVEGIDGVFVGPGDLSIALTGGRTVDPFLDEMDPVIAEISGRAVKAGRFAGLYINDPARVGHYYAQGIRFFALTSDAQYMAEGARAQLDRARASIGRK